ncbi:MAG: ABC transporter ATP-binding protein, partial [Sciscionella sp.]|nr:ABC transporter ATP-binding protein [Sciscionella sp.]
MGSLSDGESAVQIHARHIAIHGKHGDELLPPTSLRVASGELALVACSQQQAIAFALAFSGRMATDDGAVLIDGYGDDPVLRRLVGVVDAPGVTEPEPALPLRAVVAEQLAVAGCPASRNAVEDWLVEHAADEFAR